MASRNPSGRPRRPDPLPTDKPANTPVAKPKTSGQVAQKRAAAAGVGFAALLAIVGVGSYLGRDKTDNTSVIASAVVPPPGPTIATTAATVVTTALALPAVDTTTPALIVDTTAPAQPDSACPAADDTAVRTTKFAAAPPTCIDVTKAYTATLRTSKGTLTFDLDAAAAPHTVNNFVVLSRFHFYDGLTFHVIVPGYIAQGGDPLGTGEGDAGYRFADELPASGPYAVGDLLMANVAGEPSSNGSQFFIVLGKTGAALPLKYTRFGRVSGDSAATLKAIAKVGSDNGTPKAPVTIQAITISESSGVPVGSTRPAGAPTAGAGSSVPVDTTATSGVSVQ